MLKKRLSLCIILLLLFVDFLSISNFSMITKVLASSGDYGNLTVDPECENISNTGSSGGKYMPVSLETTNVHSGNSCYKATGFRSSWRVYFTKADLKANTTYAFSSWIRLDAPLVNAQGNKILFQILYDYTYLNSSNIETNVSDQKALNQFVQIEDTSTNWQAFKYKFKPDFSAATNANAISISNIRFAYVAYNLLGVNDAGINLWIDEVYVREIPPDDYIVNLLNSTPSNGEKDIAINNSILFSFDKEFDIYSVKAENILINDTSQSDEDITYQKTYDETNNKYCLFLNLQTHLLSNRQYKISVVNMYDVWNRLITADVSTTFMTKPKVSVEKIFYSIKDESKKEIKALENGNIEAEYTIKNNITEPLQVVMIIARCKNQYIEEISVSDTITISSDENKQLSASIKNISIDDGEYLRVILWDGIEHHHALTDLYELR